MVKNHTNSNEKYLVLVKYTPVCLTSKLVFFLFSHTINTKKKFKNAWGGILVILPNPISHKKNVNGSAHTSSLYLYRVIRHSQHATSFKQGCFMAQCFPYCPKHQVWAANLVYKAGNVNTLKAVIIYRRLGTQNQFLFPLFL